MAHEDHGQEGAGVHHPEEGDGARLPQQVQGQGEVEDGVAEEGDDLPDDHQRKIPGEQGAFLCVHRGTPFFIKPTVGLYCRVCKGGLWPPAGKVPEFVGRDDPGAPCSMIVHIAACRGRHALQENQVRENSAIASIKSSSSSSKPYCRVNWLKKAHRARTCSGVLGRKIGWSHRSARISSTSDSSSG